MTPNRRRIVRGVKGWRKIPGGVYVTRGTRWGNPYRVEDHGRAEAVRLHRQWLLAQPDFVSEVVRDLAGRDLYCYCKLDELCHADSLLAIANGRSS